MTAVAVWNWSVTVAPSSWRMGSRCSVKSLIADLTVAEVLKDFQLRVAVGDVR